MTKIEINKKTVISLFNKSFNQKEQLNGQVYLTAEKEEFSQAIVKQKENPQELKYDHIFYLHQLKDGTWGIANINQKLGYDNYWFSISNKDKGWAEVKEINNFLNPLSIKHFNFSFNENHYQNIESSIEDISKESAISSIEILENYLSLLKNKGDYGWAWSDLKTTLKRQEKLGQEYDQIKQLSEQEKFVEDFKEAARNEGVDEFNMTTKEEIVSRYWQKGYNGKQAWEISRIIKEKESQYQQLDAKEKTKKDLESKIFQLKHLEEELKKGNDWTQSWFDKKYPKEKGDKITKISIDGEGLKGELKIEGFENLEKIDCFKNKLTNLKITKCPNVKHLNVSCNKLGSFDFLDELNAEKLTYLSVHTNNLPESDLNIFSKFTNLEELYLDNYDEEKISEGIYNRFHGSLEPLKNLTDLRLLNIGGTDIDSGLEHLPASLRKIGCDIANINGEKSKCLKIRKELENVTKNKGTSEVLKRAEKGDTEWSGNWPRISPWRKKHNLEKFKVLGEEVKQLKTEIKNLENKKEIIEVNQKKTELENKKAKLKHLGREIEKLRKEITGENLVAEHQIVQDEIEIKKQELKELKNKEEELKKKETNYLTTFFSPLSNNSKEEFKRKIRQVEEEIIKLENKEIIIENDLKSSNIVTKAPLTPAWLLNNEGKLKENDDIENPLYDSIYPKGSFFLNSWQQEDSFLKRKLPTKLFNVSEFWKDNKEKKTEGSFKEIEWNDYVYKKDENNDEDYVCVKDKGKKYNVKDYAILSYVWGDTKGKKLGSNWSKKSLLKAAKALEVINQEKRNTKKVFEDAKNKNEDFISKGLNYFENWLNDSEKDIDYLWMDQLCIDQNDPIEKAGEVRKMRQYYSDASITLVVINTRLGGNKIKFSEDEEGNVSKQLDLEKILKIVVKSEWFSRSWTYQEGWLGKNTIFMFDNMLVDGRDLAATWVLSQPSFTDHAKYDSLEELSKNTRKIATPLGWVRYEGEYNSFDKVTLRLHETLRAIKNKGRAVPIDGIYSILGLLPYGEFVEPKYKKKEEGDYTKKDIQHALFDVMQVAWENGYGELLAWHGSGDNWVPNIDANGKSSIEGGISIDISDLNNLTITKHIINKVSNDIVKIEGRGYMIDSGACTKNIKISLGESDEIEVALLSTREILEEVSKDDILLLPNGNEGWSSNKPFAIVIKEGGSNRRLGLVEVKGEGLEKLQKQQEAKKLKVKEVEDIDNNKKLDFNELFEQIEIPPKNNT